MPYDFSPGHIDYHGDNMLPDLPTQIKQGDAQNTARLKAGSDTFKLQMQKQYGAMAGAQGAIDSIGNASDQASSVAKENFSAKMAEASVRAQLHSSYMDLMWRHFQMKNKEDRWGRVGSALSAAAMMGVGMFGGPQVHPDVGGGAGALTGSNVSNATTKGMGAGAGEGAYWGEAVK